MSGHEQEPSHHGVEEDRTESGLNAQQEIAREVIRLLIERASCRAFDPRPVPPDVMGQILQAGVHAATGGNLQPYSIIRIENQAAKERLVELTGRQAFIAEAPVNLLFCIDWHRLHRWAELEVAPFAASRSFRHFWISFQDTIIAAQNICTAADALGLGSVYIGTVLESFREIKELCQLPDEVFPVVLLSLGYPKVQPKPRRKLGPEVVVHDGVYHELTDAELKKAFEEKYPGWRRELAPALLDRYVRVCTDTHGEEFTVKSLARVQEQGYFNAVQNYFGLHYMASLMAGNNEEYLAIMKEFGFGWFEEFGGPDGCNSYGH